MNKLKLFAVAGAVALSSGSVSSSATAASIADWSFETPANAGYFDYRPSVAGVGFSGDSGVTNGFGPNPDGVQNAFLQTTGTSGAQIDISVTGLTAGNVYSFSYYDAQRLGYGVVDYTVSFDGVTIANYSPEAVGWTARTTSTFTATGSSGTLTFASPSVGYDNGAGIDAITLNGATSTGGVPEPASWALTLVGLGGLGAVTRSRRRTPAHAA